MRIQKDFKNKNSKLLFGEESYAYKIQHSNKHRYDAKRLELCCFTVILLSI